MRLVCVLRAGSLTARTCRVQPRGRAPRQEAALPPRPPPLRVQEQLVVLGQAGQCSVQPGTRGRPNTASRLQGGCPRAVLPPLLWPRRGAWWPMTRMRRSIMALAQQRVVAAGAAWWGFRKTARRKVLVLGGRAQHCRAQLMVWVPGPGRRWLQLRRRRSTWQRGWQQARALCSSSSSSQGWLRGAGHKTGRCPSAPGGHLQGAARKACAIAALVAVCAWQDSAWLPRPVPRPVPRVQRDVTPGMSHARPLQVPQR
jgi:hypothetical protein